MKILLDLHTFNDFEILSVNFKHTKKLLILPMHHKDPFDRMIISQSIVEGYTVITKDERFNDYGISIIW